MDLKEILSRSRERQVARAKEEALRRTPFNSATLYYPNGRELTRLRISGGESVADVAKAIRVKESTVRAAEFGSPTPASTLLKLADRYHEVFGAVVASRKPIPPKSHRPDKPYLIGGSVYVNGRQIGGIDVWEELEESAAFREELALENAAVRESAARKTNYDTQLSPGYVVETVRKGFDITQEELASAAGVGKRSVLTLEKDYWELENYKGVKESTRQKIEAALCDLIGFDLKDAYDMVSAPEVIELPDETEEFERAARARDMAARRKRRQRAKETPTLTEGQLSYDPEELIREHLEAMLKICTKVTNSEMTEWDMGTSDAVFDRLYSKAFGYGLSRARERAYDPNRGTKFTTWLYTQFKGGAMHKAQAVIEGAAKSRHALADVDTEGNAIWKRTYEEG